MFAGQSIPLQTLADPYEHSFDMSVDMKISNRKRISRAETRRRREEFGQEREGIGLRQSSIEKFNLEWRDGIAAIAVGPVEFKRGYIAAPLPSREIGKWDSIGTCEIRVDVEGKRQW